MTVIVTGFCGLILARNPGQIRKMSPLQKNLLDLGIVMAIVGIAWVIETLRDQGRVWLGTVGLIHRRAGADPCHSRLPLTHSRWRSKKNLI
jgi:hypothetical protein